MSSLFDNEKDVSLIKERIKMLKSEINSLDAKNSFLQCSLFSSYQINKNLNLIKINSDTNEHHVHVNELIDEIL